MKVIIFIKYRCQKVQMAGNNYEILNRCSHYTVFMNILKAEVGMMQHTYK